MVSQLVVPFLIVVSGFICLEYFIPIAVGEFLAGIVGEYFFGVSNLPWLEFFSHLGLISLMFLAGFEIDLKTLSRNKFKSLTVGGASFFIPFLLIQFMSPLLGMTSKAAAVVGVALSTTSLAIVFPILREKGILQNEAGQLLLSSAMVVDITSMATLFYLFYEVTWKNGLVLIILIGSFFIFKRIFTWVNERYQGNRAEFELKFLFLVILAFSFLAEEAGIHEAVICFILGVLFSTLDSQHEILIEKLNSIVFSLLAPIFFFHVGSMLQLREVNLYVVGVFLLFLTVSFSGKFLGTYLPLIFFSPQEAKFGAIIFNYRLSFGLVAAIFGFRGGVLDSAMFHVILLCILFSSLVSVFLEKRFILFKKGRSDAGNRGNLRDGTIASQKESPLIEPPTE